MEQDTVKVKFVGPNGPVTIARLGKDVNVGDEVEVPAEVATRLLATPAFVPVGKAAKALEAEEA